jgi:addiction module antitoxin, relB/dinJ family
MRIDPELKDQANKVLSELGLSLSGAVTIFLKTVVREKGIPFPVSIKASEGERNPSSTERIGY